jgi:type IV pilus assembly protein PilN
MIKINLLPFRAARRKENIRKQVSVFFLSFVLVLVVLIVWVFHLSNTIGDLNAKISYTKKELEKYKKINQEIASIKKRLEILNKKIAIIDSLEANRHEPVRLFDAMTQVLVPKRMWFSKLETKEKKVNIRGVVLDNKTAADFMTRLENSGLFSRVQLKTLKHQKVRGNNLKSFEITCNKKPLKKKTAEATQKKKTRKKGK